jgi:hypothetical protein
MHYFAILQTVIHADNEAKNALLFGCQALSVGIPQSLVSTEHF